MIRSKSLIALLATGAFAGLSGVGLAQTTQTNNQSSTTNQSITQSSGGDVVIGGGDQNAQNNSNTNLNNTQCIGAACSVYGIPGGFIVLNGLTQGNTQTATTTQSIVQNGGGGTLIFGGGTQNAQNNSNTNANNTQLILNGLDFVIFGD